MFLYVLMLNSHSCFNMVCNGIFTHSQFLLGFNILFVKFFPVGIVIGNF